MRLVQAKKCQKPKPPASFFLTSCLNSQTGTVDSDVYVDQDRIYFSVWKSTVAVLFICITTEAPNKPEALLSGSVGLGPA